ncbi:hypothetical protein GCM10027040_20070 [Halomonas shantousis]
MDAPRLFQYRWQHRKKGGLYTVEAVIQGTGSLDGGNYIIYRDIGRYPHLNYVIPFDEWDDEMIQY